MEGPEVRYATSGDVHIAYGIVGNGPMDVVFVSGWVLSNFGVPWEGSALDFYRGMSSFARLILFDKRGLGMSDRTQGIPDLETRMDDIRAVMDAAGSERAAIMGFSEGGPMSVLFAATYPERTAALVLYSTPLSWFRTDEYPWAPTRAETRAFLESEEGRRGTEEWYDSRLRDLAPTTAGDPATKRWWRHWVQSSASPGAIKAMSLMNSEISVCHALPAIQVPSLALNRTGDEDVPIESMRYAADRIPGASLVELDGIDHGWWVNSTQIVADIEPFLTGLWKRDEWNLVKTNRVLATVMFTDIADSTARLAEVGDARWRELVEEHHALIRRQLVRYSGREIDTAGDGFFASFDGPARAIRCAQAISDGVRELGLHVRAGLHTGECEVMAGKIGGIAVHIGARVAAEAQPDEVVVSSTVKDLVAGSGLTFADRGHVQLKGVPGEWHLYAVDPRQLPDPAELSHGPASVPDLGHVADLAALELHHIDIVGAGALAGWRHRAPLAAVGAREHGIGADVIALRIGGERFDRIAPVRDEPEQPLHPLGVLLERLHVRERFRLGCEARVWLTVGTADRPAFARLTGVEEGSCRLGDGFSGGRHGRTPPVLPALGQSGTEQAGQADELAPPRA